MNDIYIFLYNEISIELKKQFITFLFYYVIYALIEIYVFSSIISNIITYLKNNDNINSNKFKLLISNFLLYLILYVIFLSIYRYFESKIIVSIKLNIRECLLKLILKSNDNKFNDKNYTNYSPLINRFSEKIFFSLNDIVVYILPTIITTLIVSFFLLKYDYKIFIFFIIINSIIFFTYYYKYNILSKNCLDYEKSNINLESKQIESLSNFDKIIYRGFSDIELNKFKKLSNNTKDFGTKYYDNILINETMILLLINFTIFIVIYYFIYYNKIDNIVFIITLLLLYRNRIESCILRLSFMLEIISKLDLIQEYFKILIPNYKTNKSYILNNNNNKNNYNIIKFKNISFKYPNTNKYIFQNFNLTLDFTTNKLIGLYGHSGSGKSSLCKILLKIYQLEEGNIIIDDINSKNIDNSILKKNITYVTQNNKLFDNNIEYNLNYGCTDKKVCSNN